MRPRDLSAPRGAAPWQAGSAPGAANLGPVELVFAAALGIALAASAGLRAFLPLFVAALFARLSRPELLSDSCAWLSTTPALVALGVAVVVEVVADKVPALDHLLDLVQGPVRTGAGVLAAAAVTGAADAPGWATALLALVGGGVALSTHATKSALRLGSSATTGGLLNPVLSLVEDLLSLLISVLSIVAAVLALILAVLILIILAALVRRTLRWWRGRRATPAEGPAA